MVGGQFCVPSLQNACKMPRLCKAIVSLTLEKITFKHSQLADFVEGPIESVDKIRLR